MLFVGCYGVVVLLVGCYGVVVNHPWQHLSLATSISPMMLPLATLPELHLATVPALFSCTTLSL